MTERDIAARLIGVLEAIATTNAPLNVSAAHWIAVRRASSSFQIAKSPDWKRRQRNE